LVRSGQEVTIITWEHLPVLSYFENAVTTIGHSWDHGIHIDAQRK